MKNKQSLVTIYITNHNYGRFLKQSIDSVLNQSLKKFDLIIIDDGSKDNSKEIIKKYIKLPNVTVIFQKRKGLAISNNIALNLAKGKYIMRLDADDYLNKYAIQLMSDHLEKNPDFGLVYPDFYLTDESGNITSIFKNNKINKNSTLTQPANGACTMFRTKFLKEIGGYNETYTCQDGLDIWLRYIKKYKVSNIDIPLFYYRRHGKNLTESKKKIAKERRKIINETMNYNKKLFPALALVVIRGNKYDMIDPFKKLGRKIMLEWVIDPLIKSVNIKKILLSTTSKKIINYIKKKYNNKVLTKKRQSYLALPNTYINDTVEDALSFYEQKHKKINVISLFGIHHPFRNTEEIDNCINMLGYFNFDNLITVNQEQDQFYYNHKDGIKNIRQSETLNLERDYIYRQVGGMRFFKRSFFKKKKQLIGGKLGHYVISKKSGFSLQSENDFHLAKYLIKK